MAGSVQQLLLLLCSTSLCLAAAGPPLPAALPHSEPEGSPAQRVVVTETFTLLSFIWADGSFHNSSSPLVVTVCGDIDLTGGDAVTDFQYTLVYGGEGENKQVKGELDALKHTCAQFPMISYTTTEEQQYEMFVINPNDNTAKHASATFIMIVNAGPIVTIIEGELYRVFGLEGTLPQEGCFPSDLSGICYTDDPEIFADVDPCYDAVTADGDTTVQICKEGGVGEPTEELPQTGYFNIDYLTYATDAKLFIRMVYFDSYSVEAVIGKASDAPQVYQCIKSTYYNEYNCYITNFVPSYATYNVTLVGLDDDGEPFSYGRNTFTDLNVFIYQDPPMLAFNFINGYSNSIYKATLHEASNPWATATVDCTAMDVGDTCFGSFLPNDQHTEGDSLYIELQYEGDISYAIEVHYTVHATVPPSTTQEPSTTSSHA